ncbi:MAG: Gfo/Idh/MocA family oxidoreductase, partial [Armatimonadota bacterium]
MSQPFQVGLVGCGFMGRMHSAVYSVLPSADLVLACDLDLEAATKLSGKSTNDFHDLLTFPGIDVVDICLPTCLHADHAVKALEAGKHVVCEKPMALNTVDADRMVAAAKASGKTLMISHCIRSWPEYVVLTNLVKNGRLGKLLS